MPSFVRGLPACLPAFVNFLRCLSVRPSVYVRLFGCFPSFLSSLLLSLTVESSNQSFCWPAAQPAAVFLLHACRQADSERAGEPHYSACVCLPPYHLRGFAREVGRGGAEGYVCRVWVAMVSMTHLFTMDGWMDDPNQSEANPICLSVRVSAEDATLFFCF